MQILCFNQMFKDKTWNKKWWHLLKNLYELCSNHFKNWWAVLLFFVLVLVVIVCRNRKGARGLRRSCENFVVGAQTWVLLLKNYVNWVLLWCTPDYIRHTLLIKLLPIINTVISRCWKFFFVECGNGNVFLCHFSCSWHSPNRHFLKTSAIAVFSIPNSPSFAILHFTFDMRQKNITWQFH